MPDRLRVQRQHKNRPAETSRGERGLAPGVTGSDDDDVVFAA
jgi:hypothetical protein